MGKVEGVGETIPQQPPTPPASAPAFNIRETEQQAAEANRKLYDPEEHDDLPF